MAEDVITLITRDHREMEELFSRLRLDKENRPALLERVGAMLVAHSRAEEAHVYPEIAKAAPAERGEVHHGAEEHHQAEELLHKLEDLDPDSDQFDEALTEFVEAVNHHVHEEESEILPALGEAVGRTRLEELGRLFMERREQELTGGAAVPAAQSSAAEGSMDDLTKDELYEKARRAGVEGRSRMDKDDLAREVQRRT
jgi:hemerythrin superfamily protein